MPPHCPGAKRLALQRALLVVTLCGATLAFADPPSNKESEALLKEARALVAARKLEDAVVRLEKCVTATGPVRATCYKVLGSTYARLAARDHSEAMEAKARAAYERFLELAPPDDDSVPVVKKILERASAH